MSKPAPHAAEPDASSRFRMTFDRAVCSGTLAGVDLEGRRRSASRSMAAYLWESSSSPDGCRDCGRISRSKISSARSAVRLFFGHNPADRGFWGEWVPSYVSSRISFPTAIRTRTEWRRRMASDSFCPATHGAQRVRAPQLQRGRAAGQTSPVSALDIPHRGAYPIHYAIRGKTSRGGEQRPSSGRKCPLSRPTVGRTSTQGMGRGRAAVTCDDRARQIADDLRESAVRGPPSS